MDDVEETVLGLLATAPSSFASLYGFAIRTGLITPGVAGLFDLMDSLGRQGLVEVARMTETGEMEAATPAWCSAARGEYERWLRPMGASISVDAVSLDEVGMWYALTQQGSTRAKQSTVNQARTQWMLEADERKGELVIYGATEAVARKALSEWCERNPSFQLLRVSSPQPVSQFVLRSGVVVESGVELRAFGEGATGN